MKRETTCSFTGHRIIRSCRRDALTKQLNSAVRSLIEKGYTDFCSGGALGFDQLAAQTVISLKNEFPHIHLCMVLPCKNQDKYWSSGQKEVYRQLVAAADKIVYTAEDYDNGCMQRRNRFLVDSASCLLAYLEQNRGGTKYTVNYAEKSGISVLLLDGADSQQLSLL
ncbi:MAG: DUF1273 domain-containing protein [Ruminococcaceae bacterium]|nr:DUF1273 domain-containing protein [Oscillospiraceae bacterium]